MNQHKKENKRCFVICPNPSVDILATIPAIKPTESNRIQSEKRYPGGKGIHVAMALAEMMIPTTLIGLWGDKNGDYLIDTCKKYYPNLEVVGPQVEGWNRSCYTFQSTPEWKDTEILGTGPTMNQNHFDHLINLIKNRSDEIDSLAICGSWPAGALPDYNKKIVELCHELDIWVFLDCSGIQLKNALLAQPFCVHLNRHEVTEYFKEDFETAKNKVTEFCDVAAITDGSKGLYLNTPQEEIHSNVKISEVKSTVGSGDCLMAGLIAGFYSELSFPEIAKLGAACGAANCMNEDFGMLQKADVELLFLHTRISK